MQRNNSIDLIKTIAIICVLTIHICPYTYPFMSFDWLSSIFLGALSRAAVPLFFMCTGALFFNSKKATPPPAKIYTKTLPRIVIAMLCWSMLYHIYHLFITENFSFFTLWHAFKQTLLFKQEFHFYYLHIIILVYIMVPVIRVFTRSATKVELRYALLVWFALGIVYPTFKMIYPLSMLSGIPLQWMINMTYSSIGYLLLGHYLSEYPLSKSLSVSFTVIGFITVFFGVVFMSAKDESLNTAFFEGMSVGVALYATGIFALCTAKKSPNRFFLNMSNASFCIYLSHMFFVYLIRKIFPCTFSPFLYVPVCVCAVMCASFTVWLILKKIPLISKWLI